MQAKLLRVLETEEVEKIGSCEPTKVDVRIVAATNQDLLEKVAAGIFRSDLLYRLNVMPILVPTLRERIEDLPGLVDYFLERFCAENGKRKKTISDEALNMLMAHPWPGNIRELKNSVERLSILVAGEVIESEDISRVLPVQSKGSPRRQAPVTSLKAQTAEAERKLILERLEAHAWQISETARDLGLERSHLYKKMKQHGILKK
jgi:DNA-binding NtrC family response regulator